ncbi:MAG: endonuclease/exonuclease/phosphatase family protein, partial [Rhodospirillaceae bacterium]|nr:endonuclease/exonuclease/phosphatase family protein [Rhodospirillaceae bacterium]
MSASDDGNRLVLASFNLDSFDDRPGLDPPLAARIAVLRPVLERAAADVLCLQEVNAQRLRGRYRALTALDRLLAGTRYEGYARVSTESPTGHGPHNIHNLVILSRLPLRDSGEIHHQIVRAPAYRRALVEGSTVRPERVRWDRPLLYAVVETGGGRPLWVINLHLRAPLASFLPGERLPHLGWRSVPGWAEGFFLSSIKRIGQALEARLFVDRLLDADPQALVAVCGDFNAEGGEMPVRLIEAAPEDTGNPALALRRMARLGEAEGIAPGAHTMLHAGRPLRPDHILASAALAARHLGTRVLNEDLPDDTGPPRPQSVHA